MRRIPAFPSGILLAWFCWIIGAAAAEPSAMDLLQKAREAAASGDRTRALAWVTRAITADDKLGKAFYLRGKLYAAAGEPASAVNDFNRALELPPEDPELYNWRGGELFKLNRIEESIADFDRFLRAFPDKDPYHWQRGIAYYYAGRFEEGSRQFERHQTVNPADVENAVWHFLCLAKLRGLEKARQELIPIQGDSRVPMKQVHDLFAGRGGVEEVLKAAESGDAEERKQRLFYAHLYLALYFDAMGDKAKTREHIMAATGPFAMRNYMGDVARIHALRLGR